MRSYTTYIFDLDGTITNTGDVWLGIMRDGLIHVGVKPPVDKELAWYTHDWKELSRLGLSEELIQEFTLFAITAANERLSVAPLHEGALEMLHHLKRNGKNLAIVSAMRREMFEPAMISRNLTSLVEVAIAGTDVLNQKPHPDGIFKALEDLGIPKEEYKNAVYLGDKDTDIQAATNAGIDGILFYPVAHQLLYDLEEVKKHSPTYIVTDWQELLS